MIGDATGCKGTTVVVQFAITNDGPCEETFAWEVTKTGGSALVVPMPAAGAAVLAPGASLNVPLDVAIDVNSPPGNATLQLKVKVGGGITCTDSGTISILQGTANIPFGNGGLGVTAPSIALGPCVWGLTFPESVTTVIGAECGGGQWCAVLTDLTGNYSQQVRLLPAEMEVTGVSGNTTAANYCAQVTELDALGFCPGAWYMLQAVQDHEDVHLSRFQPALNNVDAAIEAEIEAICTPHVAGWQEVDAIAAIEALPAYAAAGANAQAVWLGEALVLVAGDHAPGGPTQIAEHAVVDPMVAAICGHAAAQVPPWAACAPPCP